MIELLRAVAIGLLALCGLLGWTFVVLYSRVTWYKSAEGRHLMKFTVCLALMYSLSILFLVVDPKPLTRVVLSILLFGWTAWELGNRIRLHLRAKRELRDQA